MKNTLICYCCGKEKKINCKNPSSDEVYRSNSDINSYNNGTLKTRGKNNTNNYMEFNQGYMPYCKNCVEKQYDSFLEKYNDIRKSIYYTCMRFDIYYNAELVDISIEKVKNKNTKAIKEYIKNAHMINYLGRSFLDSEDIDNNSTLNKENEIFSKENDFNESVTQEVVDFWGFGLAQYDYVFLEEQLFKLRSDFECTDVGMEMIMKDISFINLDIHKERTGGNPNQKTIKELIESRSKLMTDGSLKPIQATGVDKNEKVSFGVFAKKYENERPAPQRVDDEMKRYMEIFIPGHLAKMEGLKNETVDRYEKELEKYTISFEDVFGEEIIEDK